MSAVLIALFVSLIGCLLIIRFQHLHKHVTGDTDLSGVQKFHTKAVPRIGGLPIFIAIGCALIPRWTNDLNVASFATLLLVSALPCFLTGLLEDLTKKIGAKERLVATMVSAAIAGWFLDAWLTNVQIFGIDWILSIPIISMIFTCFCIAGVANSFNLIDGYHGLSSAVAVIILTALGYVAFQIKDYPIMVCSLAGIGAIVGFLFWNYPRGLIFLGDGGAYLIGFWIAELSLLLVLRNPTVSKWFPLLLCLYPIFETVFTVYRRVVLMRVSPGLPDASHLHQIIYKRVVRWAIGSTEVETLTQRNAITAPYLWLLSSVAVVPAIIFWNNHIALKICSGLFAITYVWLYWSIVRFKTPKWLIIQK
jgi:UDP-N-acetylmuramyl pentapeptide phosphotransferase/UDP-N-acetylglucosamine-1-phosphate transferase